MLTPHPSFRRHLTLFFAVTLLAALLLPSLAFAHSIFIQSGRYQVKTGKASPLFFCYGHHFPVDDAVRRKKLAYVRVIDPEGVSAEITLRDEKSLHSYLVKYEKPGTYILVAETNPGYFAMYTDKKGRKRHSLKPMHTFVDKADSVESSMRSSQWTKTYVTSGTPSDPFPAQAGLPLELLPGKDLSGLTQGDSVPFKVYYDGKPYVGKGFWDATYAGFSTEAEDMYFPRTEVTNGEFTLPIDHSGRWFVRFFTKTDAPEDKKSEYLTEKRTTSLTFEVRNPRIRPKTDSH